MLSQCIRVVGVLLVLGVYTEAIYTQGSSGLKLDTSAGHSQASAEGSLKTYIRAPISINVSQVQTAEVERKVAQLNSTTPVSSSLVTINGQTIKVPVLTDQNLEKNKDAVRTTMVSFADTLRSVTDEEECGCDPKDSNKSVREVIEATSRLCQDLLRCILGSLKKTVSSREATLIRAITKESMDSLSRSVDGIYAIWKSSDRESKSVQTIVDGMMTVLKHFSSRLTTALSSDTKTRLETVTFMVNSLVDLVANTSEAIGADLNENMSDEQMNQATHLANNLAEPLTSSALSQFVSGTARIPTINKLLLQFVISSRSLKSGCSGQRRAQADLNKAILVSLSKGLKSMNIKVGSKDPNNVASAAHRTATTNLLINLIQQIEIMLKASGKANKVSDECNQRAGEGLSNVVAIVKQVVDNIQTEIKDSKQRQQVVLGGDLAKGFADIINVIGAGMVQSKSVNGNIANIANISNCIYQQLEVLRRIAKNDQAISSTSEAGTKATVSLLTDVARLEIKYVQVSVERMRDSQDSVLRMKTVKEVTIETVKLLTIVGREVAPSNNKPLNLIVQQSGNSLTSVLEQLEKIFSTRPHTYGDVLYEIFYSLIETGRRLVQSATSPPRAGLPTTAPTDVIYYTCNSIRTAVDWSNALTRSSGMDPSIQKILVKYVIEIIVQVRKSHSENEKGNTNIDSSINSELDEIKKQLQEVLSDLSDGSKTTTQSSNEYDDYLDSPDKSPASGISQLDLLLHNLDDLLNYIIEGGLEAPSSLVTRNSETIIHVISVLLEDVVRTPQINEDGSIKLPSGTMKPSKAGESGAGSGVTTTAMPSSPETKPPQTTTLAPTTPLIIKGRDGDKPELGHTGKPAHLTTASDSQGSQGPALVTTSQPDHQMTHSTGHTSHEPTGPIHVSTGKPDQGTTVKPDKQTTHSTGQSSHGPTLPGHVTTGKPSEVTTGKPGQETTHSNGHSSHSPTMPGHVSTGKVGQGTSSKPGEQTTHSTGHSSHAPTGPIHITTGKPEQGSSGKPNQGKSGKPGHVNTGKPGRITTAKPSQQTTHSNGHSSHGPIHITTGKADQGRGGKEGQQTTHSTGHSSQGPTTPGNVSTGKPGQVTTGKPGEQSTLSTGPTSHGPTMPGHVSTGKAGQGTSSKPGEQATHSTGHSSHAPTGPIQVTTGKPEQSTSGKWAQQTTDGSGVGTTLAEHMGVKAGHGVATSQSGELTSIEPAQLSAPSHSSPSRSGRGHEESCGTHRSEIDTLLERLRDEAHLQAEDLASFQSSLKLILGKIAQSCGSKNTKPVNVSEERVTSDILAILVANQAKFCTAGRSANVGPSVNGVKSN